jgi:hypothetical protein
VAVIDHRARSGAGYAVAIGKRKFCHRRLRYENRRFLKLQADVEADADQYAA